MRFSLARLGIGLVLIAIAVGLLLDVGSGVDFGSFAALWWPALLILGGALVIVDTPRNWVVGIVLGLGGIVFLLSTLDVVAVSAGRLIAPVILLGLGASLLIGALGTSRPGADPSDRALALFGSNAVRAGPETFTGRQASALFGAVEIDLRDATIEDGARIDVFTFAGGVEIRVPDSTRIINQTTAVLGAVEDATQATDAHGPRLYVRGQTLLGGVELRN